MKRLVWALLAAGLATTLVAGCSSGTSEIRIGHYAPISGDMAAWGQMEKKALDLAVEEVNKAGGILGKPVKLFSYDDKGDKVEAVNVAKKLVSQDKVCVVIGENTSSASMAVAPVLEQAKIPAISTAGTNPKVTEPEPGKVRPYYFRVCFIDPFQGRAIASYAYKKMNARRVAILYDLSQDYSLGLTEFFKSTFTELGGQVVAEETFKGGEEDFRAQLTRIKPSAPDVIFLPIYYKEAALIMKQARELGIQSKFVGGDGLESQVLIDLGGPAVEGVAYTSHYSAEDPSPIVQNFIKKFKEKYKEDPDLNAVLAYDAFYMAIDAIKRAGSADPVKIRDALENTKELELVSGRVTIDPKTHNPKDKDAVIITVKNGKFTFTERIRP
ncbi:MAG TPA: ABC transporter substrate-binding protein [Firmicutes bacterium]|nr:ABC transporter substrate-binding protein [Bacillota bacterium]